MISKLKNLDLTILLPVILLIIFSIVSIYSATYGETTVYWKKQLIFGILSILTIIILTFTDYKKILNLAPYLYAFGILMLLYVKFFGITILGAKRWINIGIGTIQPSELMKFIIIITVAYMLHTAKLPITWKDVIKILAVIIVPFVLILKQPDLGTALSLLFPIAFILFLAEIDKKYIIGFILTLVIASPLIYSSLEEYQKRRIQALFNPEADPTGVAYHIIQSKIAIGSGGLYGKGFLQGTQSKLLFLPEKHNDFIFASISEEWGFVVSVLIVLVFLYLGIKILYWGQKVKDKPAKFICYGVGGLLAVQSFVNIAMTMGLAPVVGITLPFLSYGGTSLLSFSMMIGIVSSIVREYKENKLQF
jgi:rod shape determining protein RodA